MMGEYRIKGERRRQGRSNYKAESEKAASEKVDRSKRRLAGEAAN